jgi:hypothetical protein
MNNRINPESARGKTNIATDENGIPPVLRENTVHVNYGVELRGLHIFD